MQYLTAGQILLLHAMVVDETGGLHGVRDLHAILSLVALPRQRVFGRELYPTIWRKAAVYTRGIIAGHPFIDGNKRTGVVAIAVYLQYNGYTVTVRSGETEKFALAVAKKKLSLPQIARWWKQHCQRV